MYERMLNKQEKPTMTMMTSYCGCNAGRFTRLNSWMSENYKTVQQVTFPYGNRYGWGIAHRIGRSSYAMYSLKTTGLRSWSGYRINSLNPYMKSCSHMPGSTLTINIPAATAAGYTTASPAKPIMTIYKGYWL